MSTYQTQYDNAFLREQLKYYENRMQTYEEQMQTYDKQIQTYKNQMQAYESQLQSKNEEIQRLQNQGASAPNGHRGRYEPAPYGC